MPFIPYPTQLLETAIILVAYLVLRRTTKFLIRTTVGRAAFKAKEEKEIWRLLNVLILLVSGIVLCAVWGVEQSQLLVFTASVISVLGVAFFADMSILSNITACLIIFFQHPVKIGDRVRVFDGDQWVEGELKDITYFFVFLGTAERGLISIPNAALLKNPFIILDQGGSSA